MTHDTEKLKHLEWAIESRNKNQRCALRLLRLFTEYEEKWKTQKFARAAQDLLSASFSLWRAAFLADKTGQRTRVFADGKEFLEKIIEDNAISYPQDRRCKEWTFNYYTRNARSALQVLGKYWSDQVPAYEGKTRTPRARWEYCQELLDTAVTRFDELLQQNRAKDDDARRSRETRDAAR
jgi:hypothetical protein